MAAPRLLLTAGVLAGALLAANAAQASVSFYTTKAAFDAASTTSLLEDFSTAPVKDAALPSLTLNGVTYTGFAGSPFPNVFVTSPGYSNYGAAVGTTTDYILAANGDEDIVAAFSTTYTAVGFSAFYNGLGDGTLTVFGPASSVLGSFTFLGGLDPATGLADKGYLGFTSTTAVFGFEWDTTLGGTLNTGFTDISVGKAGKSGGGVPEPATWAMLLMGFFGLGAALRRGRALAA
jgi:hypothetical protein